MAKIIESRIESEVIGSSYKFWQFMLIGALLGALFSLLVEIIKSFTSSSTIPSDISTIFVAVIGIFVMVRLNMVRPLIISIASAITLWGLVSWTQGLPWFELFTESVILYSLSYLFFSWVARYTKIVPALFIIIISIIILRVYLIL